MFILIAVGVSCAAFVASAAAEVSSVDAYGGQAAVLGKPVHKRSAHQAPGSGGRSNGASHETSAGVQGGGAGANGGPSGGSSPSGGGSNNQAAPSTRAGGPVNTPARLADSSAGSLSLSAPAVLLIVLLVLMLIAVTVAMRRMERPAR